MHYRQAHLVSTVTSAYHTPHVTFVVTDNGATRGGVVNDIYLGIRVISQLKISNLIRNWINNFIDIKTIFCVFLISVQMTNECVLLGIVGTLIYITDL